MPQRKGEAVKRDLDRDPVRAIAVERLKMTLLNGW